MEKQILDLILKIDNIDDKQIIKEELAKILLNYDNEILKIDIDNNNKNCCLPSACISSSKCCEKAVVDVNTSVTLPEVAQDTKKCCVIL
jgi:hypothetical protein